MIESVTRPLTTDERALLPKGPGVPVRWTAGIGAAGAMTVIAWLLALLIAGPDWTSPRAERGLLLFGVVTGVATYLYVAWRERRPPKGPTLWDDVQAGTAEVTRYEITDALAVEEFEDEGLSYYLQLTNGQVVFLMGQYLYEPVEQAQFPARRLEIVRTAVTGTVLRVTALGPHLAPSSTRKYFSTADFDNDRVPVDGSVLPGPLDQYRGQAA